MSKTHYAGCEHANESDNNTYWDEKAACGIYTDNVDCEYREQFVTCKNCLKVIAKYNRINQQTTTDATKP